MAWPVRFLNKYIENLTTYNANMNKMRIIIIFDDIMK